ncbi:hypothetical protein MP638_005176 [Amoeboaphelidium occidentale]|nr:hypothetical protein MP638_005176 [Amoeboaphelidium occidentale]
MKCDRCFLMRLKCTRELEEEQCKECVGRMARCVTTSESVRQAFAKDMSTGARAGGSSTKAQESPSGDNNPNLDLYYALAKKYHKDYLSKDVHATVASLIKEYIKDQLKDRVMDNNEDT